MGPTSPTALVSSQTDVVRIRRGLHRRFRETLESGISARSGFGAALAFEDFLHGLDRVSILGQLVGAQATDARKAQRVTALVACGTHHVIGNPRQTSHPKLRRASSRE